MSSACNHNHGWGELSLAFAVTGVLIFIIACLNVMDIVPRESTYTCPYDCEKAPRLFGNSIEDWYLIAGVILLSIISKIVDIIQSNNHHH